MGYRNRLLCQLLCLMLSLHTPLAIQTVSEFGQDWPHECVQICLGRYPLAYSNVGGALQCGTPFYNDCYCATAAASATKVTSVLAACASTSCGAGDLSDDLSAMQSKYASYCMANGFTQPGATNWYNPAATTAAAPSPSPAPGNTGAPGPAPSTTTQLSLVTHTAPAGSGAPGSPSSQLQVITVDATSTLWVNPAGSAVAAPSTSSSSNNNTLALGLGAGLGGLLALSLVAFGIYLCVRHNRRKRQQQLFHDAPPSTQQITTTSSLDDHKPSTTSPLPIPRKAVPATSRSPSTVLASSGEIPELRGGQGVRRELGGTGLHPFPNVSPSPPVPVPGQHELHGRGWQPELPGQSASRPPQCYQAVAAGRGTPGGREHWELP